jgi:glutathione S-transferase
MDWRAALRARLTGLAGGQVYWAERPQATTVPAIVLIAVSDDRPQHLKGYDLAPGRVQIDSYGANSKAAWDLAEAALAAVIAGGTFNGHNFSRADVALGPRDLTERVSNTTVFRVSMDLIFHHAEVEEAS